MKSNVIIVLLLLIAAGLQAQLFNYVNITGSNPRSNRAYIGISNQLIMQAAVPATAAKTSNGEALLQGDTLLLMPVDKGPFEVILTSANGEETLFFEARVLPEVQLILENHPPNSILLSRFKQGQQFVIKPNELDDFWTGYTIESFYANIGMSSVQNTGSIPATQLTEAVKKAPKGSMLHINLINLVNEKTGLRRTVKANLKYTIN
jgi:hypothetical protein